MQFETKYAKGIADGSQTLTFRRWKRPQALPGNTYRTAAGRLVVEDVRLVQLSEITESESTKAGYPSAAALVGDLRGPDDLPVYRVQFHAAAGDDPRDVLAAEGIFTDADRELLVAKLARLDKASGSGPWTAQTIEIIAANPTVRAGDLAPHLGQELLEFKLNVRKLKNLGLTISLGTGYKLSPRGEAFLRRPAG